MTWTLIPAASLTPTRWRNGLGTSRDIATERGPAGELLWQVSIADLERDGPFSHYPDCERVFTPIAGDPPPQLAFHGGTFEPCPLLTPKRFPGDIPTISRIPAPGQAFNAIVDRRRFQVEVKPLHLATGEEIAPEGLTILHCLSGSILAGDRKLEPGDSAIGAGVARTTEPSIALLVMLDPV